MNFNGLVRWYDNNSNLYIISLIIFIIINIAIAVTIPTAAVTSIVGLTIIVMMIILCYWYNMKPTAGLFVVLNLFLILDYNNIS